MSIAALIRRMTDAGAPPEAIAIAVEEIEALQMSLDARRAADRDRKRAQRERQKEANVTGQSEDSHGTVTPIVTVRVSPDKKAPQTPKEITPSRVCETRARGWHRLPEDWSPRALPSPVQAKVDLWPPGSLDDELASFRRWAANAENKNGKGRKLDWDQAWRNWIGRRHDERYSRSNTMGRHQSPDGLSPTTRAALDVFGR
jgi:hypothetical protein